MEHNLNFFQNETFLMQNEYLMVSYQISGDEKNAYKKAQDICLEQTIELPEELIPSNFIRENIVAEIHNFEKIQENLYHALLSFNIELTAYETTQLLNLIYGNISMKEGIKIIDIVFPNIFLKKLKGPRFGISGIRDFYGIKNRPFIFTALKPMGLSNKNLAILAYKLALGGMDIIKDDHSLSNQPFSPFKERVEMCIDAVNRANRESGNQAIYMPNITSPFDELFDRAKTAKKLGAKGLMISPGIIGFDTMKAIANDDSIALPIIAHPSFLGSFVNNPYNGLTHGVLFGKLMRIFGADGSIFPNYGGRFVFNKEDCAGIMAHCKSDLGHIRPIYPSPGGGLSMQNIQELKDFFGKDVMYLMGGGLFRHGNDLIKACQEFKNLVKD